MRGVGGVVGTALTAAMAAAAATMFLKEGMLRIEEMMLMEREREIT